MKILLSNNGLSWLGGSETWTYTMARELVENGHHVDVFTHENGLVGEKIVKFGKILTSPPEIDRYDLAIINHNTCLSAILKSNAASIPLIYTSHGVVHKLEQPIPGAHGYISISEEVAHHLSGQGFPSMVIRNGVDCQRFKPKQPINVSPKKALLLQNHPFKGINEIIDACTSRNIEIITAGYISVKTWDIETVINEVDIVIALGRGCYEAMACGRNVIVAGPHGLDGMVDDGRIRLYRLFNCSGRYDGGEITRDSILAELERYDETQGLRNRKYALMHYNIAGSASKYLAFGKMLAEGPFTPIEHPVSVDCSKNEVSLLRKSLEEQSAQQSALLTVLGEKNKIVEVQNDLINKVHDTLSWKITKPLREGKKIAIQIKKLLKFKKIIKIAGITRVRNEKAIIQDTLDHFSRWCNHGIYVYDDCSTDNTAEICKKHINVKKVVAGGEWDFDRQRAEYKTRDIILKECQKDNPDWIIYFDADERIDWDFKGFEEYDAVRMKLFDYYITEEDKEKNYRERKYLGPEYRNIIMLFKNSPYLKYHVPDQREVTLHQDARILDAGYVKHYGKAISIEEWESTCDYYVKYFPEPYASKWAARKGKAVHFISDFNRALITWDQKESSGIPLE